MGNVENGLIEGYLESVPSGSCVSSLKGDLENIYYTKNSPYTGYNYFRISEKLRKTRNSKNQ